MLLQPFPDPTEKNGNRNIDQRPTHIEPGAQ